MEKKHRGFGAPLQSFKLSAFISDGDEMDWHCCRAFVGTYLDRYAQHGVNAWGAQLRRSVVEEPTITPEFKDNRRRPGDRHLDPLNDKRREYQRRYRRQRRAEGRNVR